MSCPRGCCVCVALPWGIRLWHAFARHTSSCSPLRVCGLSRRSFLFTDGWFRSYLFIVFLAGRSWGAHHRLTIAVRIRSPAWYDALALLMPYRTGRPGHTISFINLRKHAASPSYKTKHQGAKTFNPNARCNQTLYLFKASLSISSRHLLIACVGLDVRK